MRAHPHLAQPGVQQPVGAGRGQQLQERIPLQVVVGANEIGVQLVAAGLAAQVFHQGRLGAGELMHSQAAAA